MATVSGWESLTAITKKRQFFVPAGFLDPPLLEIKISKLIQHRINGREFYLLFYCNLVEYKK